MTASISTRHVGPFQVDTDLYAEVSAVTENPSLSNEEREVLRRALRRGFLVDSTRQRNDYGRTRASALWRSWCETLAIPLCRFLPRKLYSPVELDLRPAHKLVKREYCGQLREAIARHDTTKHPRNKGNCIGPDIWSAGQIPVGKIPEVAGILLDAALHLCEPDGNAPDNCGPDDYDPDAPDPLALW